MAVNRDKFWAWLDKGIENGWVSKPYCETHEGGSEYQTEFEKEQWEQGFDPCQTVIRVLGVDE